jgi:hypothetical protein
VKKLKKAAYASDSGGITYSGLTFLLENARKAG